MPKTTLKIAYPEIWFLCLIYFLCLLPIYLFPYYVPDFFLYHRFGQWYLAAQDGFSSLFIQIAALPLFLAVPLHVLCLLCMTFSLGTFMYFGKKMVSGVLNQVLITAAIFSCGIWYYFYGKLFYDIPFSLLSMSLTLLLLLHYHEKKLYATLFWILLGFTLSWKPYNLFAVAGLVLLLMISNQWRHLVFLSWQNNSRAQFFSTGTWTLMGQYLLLCIGGYCLGNYQIFIHPFRTIRGILAYPSSFNFFKHLFQGQLIWDHVNSMGINLGTYAIPAVAIILFIIPLFLKHKLFSICGVVFAFLYYAFITFKSPGFIWHSFMPAVFLLLFLIFILQESQTLSAKRQRFVHILAIVAISWQCFNNFFMYLPKEISWFSQTQKAIQLCRTENTAIADSLEQVLNNLNGSYVFYIALERDTVVKGRRTPVLVQRNPQRWKPLYQHLYQVSVEPITEDYIVIVCLYPHSQAMMHPVINRGEAVEQNFFAELRDAEAIYDYGNYHIKVFPVLGKKNALVFFP